MLTSLPASLKPKKKNIKIEKTKNRISAAVLASLSSPDAQERERFGYLEVLHSC